ncbi:hypothetical protein MBLNU230_g3422t1 [Neophaeotheca triangularis]
MPAFKALNIESDDESDVEVDDTKELQTEEALKLYQIALKYHAQGPASFPKAGEAYEQLFQSEIFKYPESQTELRRIELFGPLPETFQIVEDANVNLKDSAAAHAESGPSTLPHILHLSHKNYAQFKLDNLAANIDRLDVQLRQIISDATDALDHFVQALDKDDTDLDLWRRTGIVGNMLHSGRVARFCLEAVLDGDDEGIGNALSLPGLEEGLAGQQLRELVVHFSDRLSFLQAPLSTTKRRILSKFLKQRLGPYDDILQREQSLETQQGPPGLQHPERTILKAPRTWTDLGDAILRQYAVEQNGSKPEAPNNAIAFEHSQDTSSVAAAKLRKQSTTEGPRRTFELPKDIEAQFPGLDGGRPTVVLPNEPESQAITKEDVTMNDASCASLPTRKRSGEAAGIQETTEEGRSKSRRIRARDSTLEAWDNRQSLIDINTQWEYDQQLNEVQAVDDWVYETAGSLFERIGVVGFQQGKSVRQELDGSNGNGHDDGTQGATVESGHGLLRAKRDLHAFLEQYTDHLGRQLLVGGVNFELDQQPRQTGANVGPESVTSKGVSSRAGFPETGLANLTHMINDGWYQTQDIACAYLSALLRPNAFFGHRSSYRDYQWPESLKTMVVRVLVTFDEAIYRTKAHALELEVKEPRPPTSDDLAEEVETVFELHLDVYYLIKQANSGVDPDTIATQGERLQRWASLAQYAVRHRHLKDNAEDALRVQDELVLRFLWATSFHVGTDAEVAQDHFLKCLEDLRALFVEVGEPTIELQNNAVMPVLAVATLDQESSRLTTKDFFLKVTDQDPKDPVAMIESLQPLLETLDATEREDGPDADHMLVDSSVSSELVRFIRSSSVTVRLLLWQRLRDAYTAIDYKPMVVLCYFSMIKVLLAEIQSPSFYNSSRYDRQVSVLNTINTVKDMVSQVLKIVNAEGDALDCMDIDNLRSSIASLGLILQLTQVFNIYEDSLRIGKTQPPSGSNGSPLPSFSTVMRTVHESQVQTWMILYALLKEAMAQEQEQFSTPNEDRFDFLRSLHRNLGIRGICGALNLTFVRMLWTEFMQLTDVDGCESEQAQVFYDLFGLSCFLNPSYELIEHRCEHTPLNRSICFDSVDLLLSQASKIPIKELIKHPLKEAIDQVHGMIVRKRPTDAIMRNRDIYRTFMRSPINPLDLYQCLKGEGNQLPVSPIPVQDSWLASKGWYFLMGHMNLAKFRSQKRTGPTPTEDIDIAIAFFNQELEFSMGNWETWFRLAQAYDTKIEESVVWSAEKLNNNMSEVVQLQRAAIHCYTMATAQVNRFGDVSLQTAEKMNELYVDFAIRLYSTSREPFKMLPFSLEDSVKFFSLAHSTKQAKPFEPLRLYTAWKLVRTLCKRALPGRPQSWSLRLLLGKCLWKMHDAPDAVRMPDRNAPPTPQEVIACFVKAIELLPDKRDTRDTKREPVLEPHYKLVSIVHKMVTRGRIGLEEASDALQKTPYARNVKFAQDGDSDWARYVLAVLKNLRTADKSNWHHRMIVRAAHIRYAQEVTDNPDGDTGASGAKQELTQQMFTKTMVLQVWRPEGERAGRHFVYTARYTRFFVQILEKLRDRTNLEQLARRVRRRPNEIFEHGSVWQDIVATYLRLLRSYAAVPEGAETSAFSSIAYDEFLARKEPLERWMQATETGSYAALDVLREVNELKKINGNLVKPGPIDDLIGDSYAMLYTSMSDSLYDEERARQPLPQPSPPRNNTMTLSSVMNTDGAGEAPPPPPPPPQAEQPAARKKLGVGRREIRSTAEASAQRAAASSNAPKPHQNVRVQVVINNSRSSLSGDAVPADTSAPGSLHDDADDESELSELEEEGEDAEMVDAREEEEEAEGKRPMFPNLAGESESPASFETADEAAPDAGAQGGDAREQKAEGLGRSPLREVQDSQE